MWNVSKDKFIAKCDEDLIDDVLKLDNGSEVQISNVQIIMEK